MKLLSITLLTLMLTACATTHTSPATLSELQQGKRDFDAGYYKTAIHELMPLACDGNAEAQYAVGYMYYYGYGVAQDTDLGTFWIERSAHQGYQPAVLALKSISNKKL